MKIYIVLWKDRHTDTTATPFWDLKEAISWAREKASEYGTYPEDINEIPVDGWLYHIEYSCERDCLWITEHDIPDPPPTKENQ